MDARNEIYILDNTSRQNADFSNSIYVLDEPNPFTDGTIRAWKKLTIRFPDGPYDCEAMIVWDDVIYLVTKPWDGLPPRVYRAALDQEVATYVGNVPVLGMVTGADISEDGHRIALASYRALLIFEGDGDPGSILQSEPLTCPMNARQVEAVAWMKEDLFLTNEQRDLFRLEKAVWQAGIAPFLQPPRLRVARLPKPPTVNLALDQWQRGPWLVALEGIDRTRIGRFAWSDAGLHIGLTLPRRLSVSSLSPGPPENVVDWFKPGKIYLLLNPDGLLPLVYGPDDRCIVIGRDATGVLRSQARTLLPATVVSSTEWEPPWVEIHERGREILITIRPDAPGLGPLALNRRLGFNLIIVGEEGHLLSWTPLTMNFPWDAPSVWGLALLE